MYFPCACTSKHVNGHVNTEPKTEMTRTERETGRQHMHSSQVTEGSLRIKEYGPCPCNCPCHWLLTEWPNPSHTHVTSCQYIIQYCNVYSIQLQFISIHLNSIHFDSCALQDRCYLSWGTERDTSRTQWNIMQSIGKTSGVHTATSEPTNEMALMAGSSQIKSTGARDPWITFSVPASKHSQNPHVNALSVKLDAKVLFVRLD